MRKNLQLIVIGSIIINSLYCSTINNNNYILLYKNDFNQYIWLNRDTSLMLLTSIGIKLDISNNKDSFIVPSTGFDCPFDESNYNIVLMIKLLGNDLITINSEDSCLKTNKTYLGDYKKIEFEIIQFDSIQFIFDTAYNANYTISKITKDFSNRILEKFMEELSILLTQSQLFESRKMNIPLPTIRVFYNGKVINEKKMNYVPMYFNEVHEIMYRKFKSLNNLE